MSKFKVGDKVIRIQGDFRFVRRGDICSVTGLRPNGNLEIDDDVSGSHSHENYRLYVEEGVTDILTPLQVAEAILNEDKLQVYDTDCNKWYTFSCGHRNITIEDLKHIKLRYRPKTIVINGVEVPAPLPVGKAPDKVYHVSINNKPYESYIGEIPEGRYFWATLEDAQKVQDAMLIPFNELNKSNKGEK